MLRVNILDAEAEAIGEVLQAHRAAFSASCPVKMHDSLNLENANCRFLD